VLLLLRAPKKDDIFNLFKYSRRLRYNNLFPFTTLVLTLTPSFIMGFMQASSIATGYLLLALASCAPTSPPPVDKRCDCSPNPRSIFVREVLAKSNYPAHPVIPTPPDVPLKVGIVGAGAAGLYSAVLLDSLGIDYDILEASGRVGGRIYTYRFDETAWEASTPEDPEFYDYYVSLILPALLRSILRFVQDVGAMRFPGMNYMDRIIGTANNSLIPYINSKVDDPKDRVQQIPYIFTAENTFRRYNDILQYNQVPPTADIFDAELADNGTVDAQFAKLDPTTVWANVTNTLTTALSNDFTEGFNLLMNYDLESVRSYLLSQGFTGPQVDWLETINDATDHYDMYSMSQSVLEEWIFSEAPLDSWTCINGGMDRLTNGMLQIIKNKPIMNTPVTAILPAENQQLRLKFNGTQERTYAHVISTIPLGALQTVDLTELDIDYAQRHAIRKLNYDPAMKIGMKFKSRWQEFPFLQNMTYGINFSKQVGEAPSPISRGAVIL